MTRKGCLFFALIASFASFTSCKTVKEALYLRKPTARLAGLKFEQVTLDSTTLLFDIEVNNPYPVALPLTNLDYGLTSSSTQFLTGSAAIQTTVPAKSKQIVSLPARINYLEMLRALKSVRPGSKIPYRAELGLSVQSPALGDIRLPLKKEGELTLPSISNVSIDDIWRIVKPE